MNATISASSCGVSGVQAGSDTGDQRPARVGAEHGFMAAVRIREHEFADRVSELVEEGHGHVLKPRAGQRAGHGELEGTGWRYMKPERFLVCAFSAIETLSLEH